MEDRFLVTREWILDNRTPKGAWNRLQIQALGIQWPPREGWIDRMDGEYIYHYQRERFEEAATIKAKKRLKKDRAAFFEWLREQDLKELQSVKGFLMSLINEKKK